jgi:hypothetical protein
MHRYFLIFILLPLGPFRPGMPHYWPPYPTSYTPAHSTADLILGRILKSQAVQENYLDLENDGTTIFYIIMNHSPNGTAPYHRRPECLI